MSKPLRVALLTTSYPGDEQDIAGRFLVTQIDALRKRGVEVFVVAPRGVVGDKCGFRDYRLASGGGLVANAKRKPWFLPLLLVSMVLTLRRVVKENRCDLIHTNWLLTAPFAAFGGRPVVLSLHGSGSAGGLSDLNLAKKYPRIFRWLLQRARVITCVSTPLKTAVSTATDRPSFLVPHGVPVAAEPRTEPSEPTLLFAGRLSPEKGVDTLCTAFFDSFDLSARLLIVGNGAQQSLVEQLAKRHRERASNLRVEQRGFVSQTELVALMRESTLLLMPSHSEGFGVVALEALAQGVPVVASQVGGLPDLVVDGENGRLVPPNDPETLRERVESLLANSELRTKMSRNAYTFARTRYSQEASTEGTLRAYASALSFRTPST